MLGLSQLVVLFSLLFPFSLSTYFLGFYLADFGLQILYPAKLLVHHPLLLLLELALLFGFSKLSFEVSLLCAELVLDLALLLG